MHEFKIDKMGCMSCVHHIEEELKEKDAQVILKPDLSSHTLRVISSLTQEEIQESIRCAGYEANLISR